MNSPEPNPDSDLLRRIAAGDSAALGEFYDAHSASLFALAFRILNNHAEAEDVLQDVFLQLWHKAASFDPALGRPFSWLITLTRNKAIDRLRSAQRRAQLVEDAGSRIVPEPESQSGPGPAAAPGSDEASLVRSALAVLPQEQRQAIELAFFAGLTQTEIASTLNQPLGTIKARIRRGMLKLREQLQGGFERCSTP